MKIIFSFLVLSICCSLWAQDQHKFDTIFNQWYDKHVPGLAAGAIENGKIIYLKGFGKANLESDEAITIETKFMIGDLAKQFTVLGLLILEEQGKISFDEPIRKYLPQLPKYAIPIRVKHLINHTSGLNNLDPIKLLLGIDQSDVFTQEDALDIISSQAELDFTPGTAFSYFQSDTEILVMASLIEKVSGLPFSKFCIQNIFIPLDMTNTLVANDRSTLVSKAISYRITDTINYNPINDLTIGATNIYSTAEDMAKWYTNFTHPKNSTGRLVKKLDTYVTLDSGETYTSFWGKMTYGRYFEHLERGLPMSWQFGMVGGYAANMFRYHEHNFISFVLGNNNRYNGMPAGQMATMSLENHFTEPPEINYNKVQSISLTSNQLKKHTGYYFDQKNHLTRQIVLENDTLRYRRMESNRKSALIPLSKNSFQMYVPGDNKIIVNFYDHARKSFGVSMNDSDELIHESIELSSVSKITEYSGIYHNQDLDISFTLAAKSNSLLAINFRNGTTELHPIIKDKFRSNTYMLSGIHFKRNERNEIEGFSIHTDGVNGRFFRKLN